MRKTIVALLALAFSAGAAELRTKQCRDVAAKHADDLRLGPAAAQQCFGHEWQALGAFEARKKLFAAERRGGLPIAARCRRVFEHLAHEVGPETHSVYPDHSGNVFDVIDQAIDRRLTAVEKRRVEVHADHATIVGDASKLRDRQVAVVIEQRTR